MDSLNFHVYYEHVNATTAIERCDLARPPLNGSSVFMNGELLKSGLTYWVGHTKSDVYRSSR